MPTDRVTRYQLGSILRQMIGLKISDAEMSARDLYIIEGLDPLPEDAAALAVYLFDDQDLAIAA